MWAALEAASNKPIAAIALGFSQMPGIPLIHVSTRCAGNKLMVTLRQDRYALNDPYAARQSWQVPVALGRPGDTHASHTELVGAEPKVLMLDGCDRPVKANYGDVGYYRVHYDDAHLKSLGAVYRQFAPADRVSLMADAWAAVRGGPEPGGKLSRAHPAAVRRIRACGLGDRHRQRSLDRRSERGRDVAGGVSRLCAPALRSAFDRLGWEPRPGEEPEAALLRHRLIADLAALGDPEVTAEARRRFAALMRDRSAVAAALREPVARAVAASADRTTYDDLLHLAREQASEQERMIYFGALAGARNEEFVEQTVQIARSDAKLPPAQILPFLERAARPKRSSRPGLEPGVRPPHRDSRALERAAATAGAVEYCARFRQPRGGLRIAVGRCDPRQSRDAPVRRRGGRGDRIEGRPQDDADSGRTAVGPISTQPLKSCGIDQSVYDLANDAALLCNQ